MSLGPPRQFAISVLSRAPATALEVDIAQEMASALGRLGRRLESALAALAAFDSADRQDALTPQDRATRTALLDDAGDALWHFIVQREACGLRNSRDIQADYRVPAVVWSRMGALPGAAPDANRAQQAQSGPALPRRR